MGYCMTQEDCKFVIKEENKTKALEAIKKDLGGKGTCFNDSHDDPYYSWVDNSYFVAVTLEEVMECWRWSINNNEKEDKSINNIQFEGEKLGDDNLLFDAIAPYVEPGSFIEMKGEDGVRWKWVFDGTVCKEIVGRLVWDEKN